MARGARCMIVETHYNGATQIVHFPAHVPAVKVAETIQRNLRKLGRRDGITWRIHGGGLVSALVASAKWNRAQAGNRTQNGRAEI